MATISGNDKEMSKILIMAEALEKWDEVCGQSVITSVSHVLKVNGYRGRQAKENEKSQCFKRWETLVTNKKTRVNTLAGMEDVS